MLDNEPEETPASTEASDVPAASQPSDTTEPARKTAKKSAKKTAKKATRTSRKPAAEESAAQAAPEAAAAGDSQPASPVASETGHAEPAEGSSGAAEGKERPARKTAAKRTATKTAKKTTAKKAAAKTATRTKKRAQRDPGDSAQDESAQGDSAARQAPSESPAETTAERPTGPAAGAAEDTAHGGPQASGTPAASGASLLFQPPDPVRAVPRKRTGKKSEPTPEPTPEPELTPDEELSEVAPVPEQAGTEDTQVSDENRETEADSSDDEAPRRRRRRGGRRRRKGGQDDGQPDSDASTGTDPAEETLRKPAEKPAERDGGKKDAQGGTDSVEESTGTRRRRRRRRSNDGNGDSSHDDPANTVVRVRESRKSTDDEISGFTGSTRLEAKKQRRREGREAGRRRAPIVSEAEFLARRESVDRSMVVRQHDGLTQIAVLEDTMLVEHYVAREAQTSLIGNVYLGRVQNVLPSMEAAFVDIGKGRNAVLYAGEVNWSALGMDGQPRRIESALKSGQPVLVQVTKDPVGHKGARLTGQISLPGRYLVYVPGGQTSGISRKLPDTERNRLKNLLKELVPSEAGVIIRTAAEGASEEELRRDVARLTARWEDIEKKVEAGNSPSLLYGEPDMTVKVIRDLFTEDFGKLVVSGQDAWDTIEGYVQHVAPDLMERVERWDESQGDVFASYRVDEQITKGLDRKVFLPSGGSLVIDRTEAMTVVDVNTGKFTGSGGNLEETVTKNNLEAAEEIVRQLRLRDIGGIIVIDFIDMVLESNRDLVLRRLIECLGRDRTKHQVAEVTSLGLVQMTRKRVGTGLLEAFSESCEQCSGRGVIVHHEPVLSKKAKGEDDDHRRGKRGRRRGSGGDGKSDSAPDKKREAAPESKAEPAPAKKTEPVATERDREQGDQTAWPVDEPVPQPADSAEGEPVKAPAAAPAEEQPAAAATEQPTRSKRGRRRASRPQAEASASGDATAETPAARPAAQPIGAEQRSAQLSSPEPSSPEPSSPEPPSPQPTVEQVPEPTVTTPRRGRRRAASRPAGPPQQ